MDAYSKIVDDKLEKQVYALKNVMQMSQVTIDDELENDKYEEQVYVFKKSLQQVASDNVT